MTEALFYIAGVTQVPIRICLSVCMQKPTNAHGFLSGNEKNNNSKIHSCYLLQIQRVFTHLLRFLSTPFRLKVQLVELMDINRGGTSVYVLLYTT